MHDSSAHDPSTHGPSPFRYAGGSDDGFPDFSNFPTPAQQAAFCKAYLAEMTGSEPSPADVAGLVTETEIFVKINHW